ncbi:hypothetical protein [Rhizobium leguminosarum]|uniref:hypothetical protein n=1 Tax=Rhizobium leguminosarum TaxID=384 RepID=UPI001C906FF3|nr:hypothetical protein [Rhizobium leguminosarum]MBY2988665.1 hypothetical protein [Rhizobium leguminosarum]
MVKGDGTSPVDYSERVVTFIDILGWRSIVEQSLKDECLRRRMHNAVHTLGALTEKYCTEETEEKPSEDEFSQFSDSIIISMPRRDNLDIGRMIKLVAEFQSSMLFSGFLIRGGITTGPMFHRGRIAFGPAFNRAYELEAKIAHVPRVVIDPSIAADVKRQAKTVPKHWTFVQQDVDGYFYPEYLMVHARSATATRITTGFIDRCLADFRSEPRVLAKYEWLRDRWKEAQADAPWRIAIQEELKREFWAGNVGGSVPNPPR